MQIWRGFSLLARASIRLPTAGRRPPGLAHEHCRCSGRRIEASAVLLLCQTAARMNGSRYFMDKRVSARFCLVSPIPNGQ
jgi:hypothetical protein